eukprot:TRINITY_DN32233_c0_g1_i1.p1 TRINITY_DN32233_c0_g1~~TRINITY_DN32233_c0_g1_i1.p1  ORF type:complete len:488 (-),score=80.25 TRINITY_DN32233_c0_g1_i1:474-1865(-)
MAYPYPHPYGYAPAPVAGYHHPHHLHNPHHHPHHPYPYGYGPAPTAPAGMSLSGRPSTAPHMAAAHHPHMPAAPIRPWEVDSHHRPEPRNVLKPRAKTASAPAKKAAAAVTKEPARATGKRPRECGSTAVRLRGLPFTSDLVDIQTFLGPFGADLAKEDPIRLLLNKSKKPSGIAIVHFNSPDAAKRCIDEMHGEHMGDRYIELQFHTEEAEARDKANKKTEAKDVAQPIGEASSEGIDDEMLLEDLRAYISEEAKLKKDILLSAIGIALTDEARSYLKRSKLGVKGFLAKYPDEFKIEGSKGSEKVHWTGIVQQAPDNTKVVTTGQPARSHRHLDAKVHPFAEWKPEGKDGYDTSVPVIRLRGLPFTWTIEDVRTFFEKYKVAEFISTAEDTVHLLFKANGKSGGQAVVVMQDQECADLAKDALQNADANGRYVEAFTYPIGNSDDQADAAEAPPQKKQRMS